MAMSEIGPCLWTQLPQSGGSPCDRYKHACCSYDGSVYILGGRGSSCLRDFWRYSVACNKWTELSCTAEAAPEELEEHSMVAYEGFLYVFGGLLDSAYTTCRCALWVFDVAKQKWVQWQGKTSSHQMPTNRKGHSAVVLGSAMLLYGGLVDMKGSSQEFWRLNFDTTAWSLLTDSSGPGPRHSHSATAYQDCMYLFGGLKGLREQRDFWKWNSSSHMWTLLRTKCGPSRLMGHAAVVYKDSMLIFGGGESQTSPTNCLWRYSFTTHTWGQVATLPGSSPPYKMHHCCAGLGPSYKSSACGQHTNSDLQPRLFDDKLRPFKNKCFPATLTFLGSGEAIELQTFSLDKSHDSKGPTGSSDLNNSNEAVVGNCLTFENKAFRKQWGCTDGDLLDEEDSDVPQHLPDLLLVLGGRPCSSHSHMALWKMTLPDSQQPL